MPIARDSWRGCSTASVSYLTIGRKLKPAKNLRRLVRLPNAAISYGAPSNRIICERQGA